MLDIRVYESVNHVRSEFLEFRFRKVKGLKEFLEHHLVHEFSDLRIFHTFLHCVESAEVTYRGEDGVRTVEEGDFAGMVRSLARNEEHVEACLVCREFFCYFFRSLDNPEVEDFCLDYDLVVIAYPFVNLVDGVLRIAWYDAVHEGAIYSASFFEPLFESVSELPELYILVYAFLEFPSVEENEFAREDDETFGKVTVEMEVSVIEKLGELAGI